MSSLHRHIEILLLDNDCVIIPNFGGFMAHHVEARYDDNDKLLLPPLRTLGFNQQLRLNDSLLAQSYVEAYEISYPEAIVRIDAEVEELKQQLKNNGQYDMPDIGTLYNTDSGHYTFEPCEAGILTPELYGLDSINIKKRAEMAIAAADYIAKNNDADEMQISTNGMQTAANVMQISANNVQANKNADNSNLVIPINWLRNTVAACIAVLAFFLFPATVTDGETGMQHSMADTGLLMQMMPKEMVLGSENISKIKTAEQKPKATVRQKQPQQEVAVSKNAQDFYCLVLASRITRKNADAFAQMLRSQGYEGVDVYVDNKHVSVIYGHYATREEATDTARSMRSDEAFKNCWVMHAEK